MSDPAKSADEIEDVLASIRRLVAEAGPVSERQPGPAVPGKLVLTPAHRVAEPDDPWAPVPPAAEGTGAAVTADATDTMADGNDGAGEDPSWGLEDRLSDWGEIEDSAEEAVADAIAESGYADAPPYEVTPDAAELSAAEDAFDLADLAQIDGLIDGDLPGDAFEPETGDADWPDRGADSALRDLAAARFAQQVPLAGPLQLRSTPSDTPNPETGAAAEDDLPSPPREVPTRAETTTRPATADTPSLPEDAMTDPDAEDADETPRSRPGFTPVFSRRIDTAPRAEDGIGAAETEAEEIEDLGEAPSPFSFPDAEDGILDEETLREIVAEVVRQELQGALGQRITRNVRKMVRREIRIALAAEDLE